MQGIIIGISFVIIIVVALYYMKKISKKVAISLIVAIIFIIIFYAIYRHYIFNEKKNLINNSNIKNITEMQEYVEKLDGAYIIKSYEQLQNILDDKKINSQYALKYSQKFFDKYDMILYLHPSTDVTQYKYIKDNILKIIYSYSSVVLRTEINIMEVEKDRVKSIDTIYSKDISWWYI